jgi:hypothetical protein
MAIYANITLAPLGMDISLSHDLMHGVQQQYLKLDTHSASEYSSLLMIFISIIFL